MWHDLVEIAAERPRWGRAAQLHRRGDPASAALRLGQRACKVLEEGKAYRASDIDVMWLNGFGFPRYRGGLMYWADGIGVAEVYRQIQAWHQQYGERWAPSALLRRLAETGTSLREAKPGRPM
jgi:3-hydroxyacyl-CoA dehydrogenase